MAGAASSFLLSAIPESSAALGGLAAFDPDGSPAAPEALGSGVSAAKALALASRTAAKTKLEVLNICFSLSRLRRGNVKAEMLFPKENGAR
jgi:hypothetical protein